MTTGVILVNWNNTDDTLECIHSLQTALVRPDLILVWDNASHDNGPKRIRDEFPDVRVIESQKNVGFATANNLSAHRLMQEGMDFIWILNNDTLVDPACLKFLSQHLEKIPSCAAVTATIFYADQPDTIWYDGGEIRYPICDAIHQGMGTPATTKTYSPTSVTFLTGCCILVRSEIISEMGLFPDSFIAYFEDVDWSIRMIQSNYRLDLVPGAHLLHKCSASIKVNDPGRGNTSASQHYLQTRNRLWVIRTHVRGISRKLLGITWFLVRISRFAFINLILWRLSKVRAILKGAKEGLFCTIPELQISYVTEGPDTQP